MQYSVALKDSNIVNVTAENPKDAIYKALGLKKKKGLDIVAADNEKVNCIVSLLDGKRKTQSFYNVNELAMCAIIARHEEGSEFHIYDYQIVEGPVSLVIWFNNKCKKYSKVIDDTITILLVRLSITRLTFLQQLEQQERYAEMGKFIQTLQCMTTYSI